LQCVNFIGMVVLITGIIMALLALSFSGKDYVWSSLMVLCLLIFSIVIIGMFVVIEWKFPAEPIMPLHLFKNCNVSLMLVMQLFVGTVIFGLTFYVPIYFSLMLHSMLPKLSQALINAYVVALRAVFYASIPFAVMIVIMLAIFV
ncbi:hypothetical protein FBU31_000919, partial [Coemansia sp. 'formosensis']